ncbi:TetR/AcrR family transcriptional regulator [Paenibacillus sp. HB172176]|uniref:TetR/AcrR family transcriptional regulator n=1 Tax=Paenibacillus sp. HB172176 TaxID=2493690 RepID=UPI00143C134D|nr:TetR/AcrR family transcriptional regulator [Paenibacillus sp. HB172176]
MAAPEQCRLKDHLNHAILQTAHRLFNEYGVEEVSMHQIAKGAGIGQGTLYRRYSNKADLCMDMMFDYFESFRRDIEDDLRRNAEKSVDQKLKSVISQIIAFIADKAMWLGTIQAEQIHPKSKDEFCKSKPYLFLHGVLHGLLLQAVQEGDCAQLDPNFAAHALIGFLSPYTYQHLVQDQGYTQAEVEKHFNEMLITPLFRKKMA